MEGVPCSLCKEVGHHPMRCPELCDPMRDGFSGAGGGGGGGHGDDDDERAGAGAGASNTEQQSTKTIYDAEDVVVERVDARRRRTASGGDRVVHQQL